MAGTVLSQPNFKFDLYSLPPTTRVPITAHEEIGDKMFWSTNEDDVLLQSTKRIEQGHFKITIPYTVPAA